jgi:hypothetical protein
VKPLPDTVPEHGIRAYQYHDGWRAHCVCGMHWPRHQDVIELAHKLRQHLIDNPSKERE